jgi:hypothetical protein
MHLDTHRVDPIVLGGGGLEEFEDVQDGSESESGRPPEVAENAWVVASILPEGFSSSTTDAVSGLHSSCLLLIRDRLE